MITKGNQRAGGQQLATHLMNEFDNEHAKVYSLKNTISQDLHGAFSEWRSLSNNTKCKKYLYSLSLNPWDDVNGKLSREQYEDFIDRTEKKLGLEGQPRAIVFHVKNGREHVHVAWSRIYYDEDKQKHLAKHMDHDRQKLRSIVREFAKDHNLKLPDGMQYDSGVDRFNKAAKNDNRMDKERRERTGKTKAEHKAIITEIWNERDTPERFVEELEAKNYYLCRGDKIPYAVVDRFGEVYSLPKMIDDRRANTKMVRKFLGADYATDKIPHFSKAQQYVQGLDKNKALALKEEFRIKADNLTFSLKKMQAERREEFIKESEKIKNRHKKENQALKEIHFAENAHIEEGRRKRQPKGIAAALMRITGINALTNVVYNKLDTIRATDQQQQLGNMQRAHDNEDMNLQRRSNALMEVEKREQRSLEAKLRLIEREGLRERQEERGDSGRAPEQDRLDDERFELRKDRSRNRERDREV